MQHELETERVPIGTLKPYPGNPREGDIGAIVTSLEANGQFRPIVVNRRDMTILAGNHTWKAAKSLGWDQIAVTYVDVDETQAKKIVLADNRSNDLATYDEFALVSMLRSLAEEDAGHLIGTGFDGDDIDSLILNESVSFADQNRIDSAADRLESAFADVSDAAQSDYINLVCPNCAEQFAVSRKEVIQSAEYPDFGT